MENPERGNDYGEKIDYDERKIPATLRHIAQIVTHPSNRNRTQWTVQELATASSKPENLISAALNTLTVKADENIFSNPTSLEKRLLTKAEELRKAGKITRQDDKEKLHSNPEAKILQILAEKGEHLSLTALAKRLHLQTTNQLFLEALRKLIQMGEVQQELEKPLGGVNKLPMYWVKKSKKDEKPTGEPE